MEYVYKKPKVNFCLKFQTGMTFYFVYMKISLLLHYGTIIFDFGMIPFVVKRIMK